MALVARHWKQPLSEIRKCTIWEYKELVKQFEKERKQQDAG